MGSAKTPENVSSDFSLDGKTTRQSLARSLINLKPVRHIGAERTVKGMLRSNLLLTSLILLSVRGIAQEKASEELLWHADRPSPVAIYRDLDGNPTKPG